MTHRLCQRERFELGKRFLHCLSPGRVPESSNQERETAHVSGTLTHLDRLESESIHIIREVAAEFRKPVMLYSIGKDSAVMLHLAMKAFAPGRPPFPILHVDTTWKFGDMIRFRDETAARLGLDLIVHINQDGVARGVGPFSHGSRVHTDVMKTEALKGRRSKDMASTRPLAARGGTRRSPAPRSASSPSATSATAGIPRTSARNCGTFTTPESRPARASASFRSPTGPSWMSGSISTGKPSTSCRSISPQIGRWSGATACSSW